MARGAAALAAFWALLALCGSPGARALQAPLLPHLELDDRHAAQQHRQQGQPQWQQQHPWQPQWRRRLAKLTEECKAGLWAVAKAAPDLHTLVTVQQQTTLNFFQPFGKLSGRDFTLLAPTDAAWRKLFGDATGQRMQDLQDGFAALLLYHQVLFDGYGAAKFAERYSLPSALAPAVNDDSLSVDMDKVGDLFVASGRAPQNYALVVREHEVCGAYLIVIDSVLLPTVNVASLPHLAMEHPINRTQWGIITQAALAGPAPAPAPGGVLAGAAAGPGGPGTAADGAPAPGPEPILPIDGSGAADGPFVVQEERAPPGGGVPAPPGAPPKCTTLAASGQLITVNGTLAGCGGSAEGVMSNGETQTVVSDAGQVNRSALAPPPPPSGAARAAPWHGTAPPLLALPLLAAAALLAC